MLLNTNKQKSKRGCPKRQPLFISTLFLSLYFDYYNLTTQYENLRSLSSGVRKNLNSNDIKKFKISIPSLPTQQKIAAILSALDDKIELNNKINEKLEQQAKLLYDYWFVQFDFPVASTSTATERAYPEPIEGYKSSGGKMIWNETLKREIPEGWEVKRLGEIGTIIGGSTPSKAIKEKFSKNDIPWITPKDLSQNKGNKFISKGEFDVTERGIKEASLNILPVNSVLMSSRTPIGYLAINRYDCTTNQGFKSIVCDKGYPFEYVFYVLKQYMPLIEANASGSTFMEISTSVLRSIKILSPQKSIINQFEKRISKIFQKQNSLESQNQQLSALQDWLLPMLINGQVKVE